MYVVSKRKGHLCVQSVHLVWQKQSSHNTHGISERDNISSRDPHQIDLSEWENQFFCPLYIIFKITIKCWI